MAVEGSGAGAIIPRDLHFQISANPVRRWFGGDIFRTLVVDGLSICLPEGERYFIRALKQAAAKLDDKTLGAEISGYAAQEAYHAREHEEYNRALKALGYDVEEMESLLRRQLRAPQDPLHMLTATCAIEHLTSTVATLAQRHPEILDDAAPHYRRLWMWHALEELEHKAVALNVFKAATKDMMAWQRYLLRVIGLPATLTPFFLVFLRNVQIYAAGDGVQTGLRFWLRFAWTVLVSPGYWRRCAPMLLSYFRPDYDPRHKDDAELVRRGREWLRREIAAGPVSAPT